MWQKLRIVASKINICNRSHGCSFLASHEISDSSLRPPRLQPSRPRSAYLKRDQLLRVRLTVKLGSYTK